MKYRTLIALLTLSLLMSACNPTPGPDGQDTTSDSAIETDGDLSESTPVYTETDLPANDSTKPGTESADTDSPSTEKPGTDTSTPEPEPPILPDDAVTVTSDWGIQSGAGYALPNSLALMNGIAAMSDGTTLYFPEGMYELAFPMFIIGKRNIRIVGYKTTLVRSGTVNTTAIQPALTTDALPVEHLPLTSSTSFIYAGQTNGLTVEGLTFTYDTPTSLSGRILSVNGGTAMIELTDGSPITGGEFATVINTFTEDGVPDRTLEQYAETNFTVEKVNETTIRVLGLDVGGASHLKQGMRVCLRLCTGRDYVINAQGSTDLLFKDLTLRNSYNGGIILTDRCVNATLDNIRVQSGNPESLMSLNADILHVAGLGGKLAVDGCHFEGSGDDCINVHSMAYLVNTIEGNTAMLTAPRFDFSSAWAAVGDTVTFYDASTFTSIGTAKVTAVDGQAFTFDAIPADVKKGTVVANGFMNPEVEIRNTAVKNTRARGF